ncbi:MAG: SAM-dependent methyltransferase [Bacteroidetes bacterium MedPE-SWsnd-G2]|mgnify:CR=1 FL=1|nr:MAG: SAM-dependent methyltransferase [Bacteroidetes bacterium MedPE-SWsnd-G2]
MTKDTKQWYASWFDTPFYHILYKDRDYKEAQHFMDKLTSYLNISPDDQILDLACGKGRHSVYLNSIGCQVTGVDLSENSIAHAKQFENDRLHFFVHDMCKPYGSQFDAVFNLFTSFGYFENEEDNLRTIKSIKANLNAYGVAVIDFMNSPFVINSLVKEEVKTVDDIRFRLKRYVEHNYIIKEISFEVDNETYKFQERVKAFNLNEFKALFKAADCHLLDVFGDYNLGKYDETSSERLIMVFK